MLILVIGDGLGNISFGKAVTSHLCFRLICYLLIWRDAGARDVDNEGDIIRKRGRQRGDDAPMTSTIKSDALRIDFASALQVVNPGQRFRCKVINTLVSVIAS